MVSPAGEIMGNKVVFIFLDGVGMGKAWSHNPFVEADMPFLQQLIGGPLVEGGNISRPGLLLKGLDATLGVDGTPQSATGQTALFTGVNGSKALGFHLPAFPNEPLKKIIKNDNILKQAVLEGKRATFANSYSSSYFTLVKEGKRYHSVSTLCVLSAALPFRTMQNLLEGEAVHWDITREVVREMVDEDIPLIKPELAGEHLAAISSKNDLVLFESFLTDLVGHKRNKKRALKLLNMIDRFLKGLCTALDEETTLLISSDHGNIEDLTTGGHTCNKVPLLVLGPLAEKFSHLESILQVTPAIFRAMG